MFDPLKALRGGRPRWVLRFGLAVTTALSVACSPCLRVQEGFEQRMMAELVRAGVGAQADAAGTEHVRVLLGPAMLERMALAVERATPLRNLRVQRRMGTSAEDPVVQIRVGYRLMDAQVAQLDGTPVLRMVLALQGQVSVVRPLTDETASMVGGATVVAPLRLETDERGHVRLTVRFSEGRVESFTAKPILRSADERDFARGLLEEDLVMQVGDNNGDVPLWTVEPLTIGRLQVRWAGTRVVPSDDGRSLAVSLVSNLRPEGDASLYGVEISPGADTVWVVHAGLLQAVVRYALASGALERNRVESDAETGWPITLDALQTRAGGIAYEATQWCMEPPDCRIETFGGSGVFVATSVGVLVTLTSEHNGNATSDRAWLDSVRDLLQGVLVPPTMVLADGEVLQVEELTVDVDARRVQVPLAFEEPEVP